MKCKKYKKILNKMLKVRNKMQQMLSHDDKNTQNLLSVSYSHLCESAQRLYDIIQIWRIIER